MINLTKINGFALILSLIGIFFIPKISQAQELVIQNLTTKNISDNKILINWSTNLPSSYLLEYGETNEYGLKIKNNSISYTHETKLTGLKPKIIYHFRIIAFTPDDKRTYTFDQIFKTKKITDNEIPRLIEIRNPLTTDKNAYFYLQTDEPVTVNFTYWPDGKPKKIKSLRKKSNAKKYTNLTLKGLKYNTTYIYKITIKDRTNNILKLSEKSFRTENSQFKLDDFYFMRIEPISANSFLIGETNLVVKTTTTRPSICTLYIKNLSIKDSAYFKWNHELRAEKLKPNTNYTYYLKCRDYLGNNITSRKYNIRTRGPIVLGFKTENPDKPFGGKKVTLVKAKNSPKIYVIFKGYKYYIKNPEIFKSYNLTRKNIKIISPKKLAKYPNLRLVIRQTTGEKYFLYPQKNMKKKIPSDKVNKSYSLNRQQKPLPINDTDFFSYQNLRLIKTSDSPTVYFIHDGIKRPIYSWDVFIKNAWQPWEIGIVNQTDLNSYITGPTLY